MAQITRIEVGRFDYALVGEVKFFRTPVRPSLHVRVSDDDGLQGWGQSVPLQTWSDETVVRAVFEFSPRGFHWADANTSYDLDTALALAPKLADLGLKAIESPLPPNRLRDYQTLTRQGALPVLMDEGIVSPVETAEFIAL